MFAFAEIINIRDTNIINTRRAGVGHDVIDGIDAKVIDVDVHANTIIRKCHGDDTHTTQFICNRRRRRRFRRCLRVSDRCSGAILAVRAAGIDVHVTGTFRQFDVGLETIRAE